MFMAGASMASSVSCYSPDPSHGYDYISNTSKARAIETWEDMLDGWKRAKTQRHQCAHQPSSGGPPTSLLKPRINRPASLIGPSSPNSVPSSVGPSASTLASLAMNRCKRCYTLPAHDEARFCCRCGNCLSKPTTCPKSSYIPPRARDLISANSSSLSRRSNTNTTQLQNPHTHSRHYDTTKSENLRQRERSAPVRSLPSVRLPKQEVPILDSARRRPRSMEERKRTRAWLSGSISSGKPSFRSAPVVEWLKKEKLVSEWMSLMNTRTHEK